MRIISQLAPHWRGTNSVPAVMRTVLVALIPACLCMAWLFGYGTLINLAFLSLSCLVLEALVLRLRGKPLALFLGDGSALVTAVLMALALPPLSPWWVLLTAALFAIVLAKHLYGGLGQNVFNPAMVGYVTVLVAFPQYVANWPELTPETQWISAAATLQYFADGTLPASALDALSGATPLDAVKTQLGQMLTMSEIKTQPLYGSLAGYGWEWFNLACLLGGLWLLRAKVISWHVPGSMLVALGTAYMVFYSLSPTTSPSPLLGLLSGGTMLAAFFIATDPVSGAASNLGRILFGAGTGVLCFGMRQWGAYPDGIAFAILFMNMLVPLIDRWTVPRVYGHRDRP